jgi:hypothetical protein
MLRVAPLGERALKGELSPVPEDGGADANHGGALCDRDLVASFLPSIPLTQLAENFFTK